MSVRVVEPVVEIELGYEVAAAGKPFTTKLATKARIVVAAKPNLKRTL